MGGNVAIIQGHPDASTQRAHEVDGGRADEQQEHRLAQHAGDEGGKTMPLRRGERIRAVFAEPPAPR